MSTRPVAARFPEDVASHIEEVANSPATDLDSKSAVVREIVVSSFHE
jgi:hypothetical protein